MTIDNDTRTIDQISNSRSVELNTKENQKIYEASSSNLAIAIS